MIPIRKPVLKTRNKAQNKKLAVIDGNVKVWLCLTDKTIRFKRKHKKLVFQISLVDLYDQVSGQATMGFMKGENDKDTSPKN